jgi:hypothetical protein
MKKKLAWIDIHGKARVHPAIKGNRRIRIMRHMTTFLSARKKGIPRLQAIKLALKSEHKGLSLPEIRKYELENARLAKKIKSR